MTDSPDKAETDPREGRTQRQIIWSALILIVLVVGLGLVLTSRLSRPDGVYCLPGGSRSAYAVFTNGQVILQPPASIPPLITYTQQSGQWVCTEGSIHFTVTATVLGLTAHNEDGTGRNMFLFRRTFAWIPKTWVWIQERWHELTD